MCSRIKKCVQNFKSHQYIVIPLARAHSQTAASILWGMLQPDSISKPHRVWVDGWVSAPLFFALLSCHNRQCFQLYSWVLFNLFENTAACRRLNLVHCKSQPIMVISNIYSGGSLEETPCEVSTILAIKMKTKYSLSKMFITAFPLVQCKITKTYFQLWWNSLALTEKLLCGSFFSFIYFAAFHHPSVLLSYIDTA